VRRRSFLAGVPLAGCAGVWRREAPAVEGRPAAPAAEIVEDTLVVAGSKVPVVRSVIAGSPVVHVGAVLAAGALEDVIIRAKSAKEVDVQQRPGFTALACASVVDRGLRDALGRFGAVPRFRGSLDGATVTCTALAADVPEVVATLARRLRAPTLDDVGFAALVARMQAAAAISAADLREVATRAIDRLIFTDEVGEHPYAHRGAVAAEGTVGVTREELAAHVQQRVVPTRMLWVTTGAADLRPTIAAAWDGWAAPTSRSFTVPPEPRPRTSIVLVDRPGTDQAVIAVGRIGPPGLDANAVYAERAMRILRGVVHERLRGDRGLAYYTDAGHDAGSCSGRLRLVTQVDAAATGEALKVVLWALEHVQELDVAQRWMDEQDVYDALERVYSEGSGEGRIAGVARRWLLELPLVEKTAEPRPVAKLMKMIDDLMKPAHWQIACVGDRRRLLAQLERFGSVVVR
jgi:predicted Zn-dependent peptidase